MSDDKNQSSGYPTWYAAAVRALVGAAATLGLVLIAIGTPLILCLLFGVDVGIYRGVGIVLYFSGVALRLVALTLHAIVQAPVP